MISTKLWCFFLILSITKVCQGQLMCYVCENCAKITTETPQFECNEDFFNTGGTTASSVQTTTTTEMSKTTDPITEDVSTTTTTTESTTVSSTATQEVSTTEMTTEMTTDMQTETTMETTNETSTTVKATEPTTATTRTTTAEPQPPTPPTVGPPMTTTALPTPPNPGTIATIDDVEKLNNPSEAHEQHVNKDEVDDDVDMEKATTKAYKPSAEFRVRQQRSVSDVTYHCFKIQATTTNGSMVINRGCSRVETMESVCGQWEAQHPNEKVNKCYPCTRSKCNGSSALSVSITALFVAVTAVFMHRK